MDNLPAFIGISFGIVTIVSIYMFYMSTPKSDWFLYLAGIWIVAQAFIAATGFYTNTQVLPPRFLLTIVPPTFLILACFSLKKGRVFIDSLNIRTLTILHTIRIPVELVLFWLYNHKVIPEIMTFEGRNLDILSGLSAPLIYYLAFIKQIWVRQILILWNSLCLCLLINIVSIAILSAPFSFQKFGLDQPNIAVLYFPFVWLPCCVVPLVFLAHLSAFRLLLKGAVNTSK